MNIIIKLITVFLLILTVNVTGVEQKPVDKPSIGPDCSITVMVDGFKGGKCKFLGVNGKQNFLAIPEFETTGPEVSIARKEPFPSGLYYLVFAENSYIQILLDDDQQFSMKTATGNLIQSMTVDGSLDNELLYQNLQFEQTYKQTFEELNTNVKNAKPNEAATQDWNKQLDQLKKSRRDHIEEFSEKYPASFFSAFKLAGQNPDLDYPRLANGDIDKEKQLQQYKTKFWNSFDFSDTRLLRTPVYHNKLEQYIKKLTPQKIESVIESADFILAKVADNFELYRYTTSYLCLEYRRSEIMGGEAIYVHIVDNYLTDKLASGFDPKDVERARDDADKLRPSLIGEIGQDLRVLNDKDEYESLYDLNSPIVVLYIYNVDCEHCIEETPEMWEVYKDWQDRGVEVFALSTNQDVDKWKEYIQKENLTWHNVIDPKYESKYYKKYMVDITPEIYVLNSERKIIGMNLDPHQLDYIFNKELAE